MVSVKVLNEMEQKLDELITNANLLKACEESSGECAHLEHQQERLLDSLMQLNSTLDEDEKSLLLQRSPRLYITLEKKISRLSHLNRQLLRSDNGVKKARVHRKKIKKPPTQMSFDIN